MPVVILAVLVSVLALAGQAGGIRLIHHAQYQRCLANIARMEIDLGLRAAPPPSQREVSHREYMSAAAAAKRWNYSLQTAAPYRDDLARQIKANRKESVRIAKAAMGRPYIR